MLVRETRYQNRTLAAIDRESAGKTVRIACTDAQVCQPKNRIGERGAMIFFTVSQDKVDGRWIASVTLKDGLTFIIIRLTRKEAWRAGWEQITAIFQTIPEVGNA